MTAEIPDVNGLTKDDSGRVRVGAYALVVLLGCVFRLIDSSNSSFWLDELHTLSHAARPSLGDTADAVQQDFHAPLFYFCVRQFQAWFPPHIGPHVLRTVNLVASVLILIPVGLLAGRIGGRRTAWTAAAVTACLPFQIHFGTEFRPYSLLMLCAATAGYAAFDDRGSAWLRWILFSAATAIGTLNQFLMGLIIVGIGFGRVVAFLASRFDRRNSSSDAPWRPLPLWSLVIAGALGGSAILPWVFGRMPWLQESGGSELLVPDDPAAPTVVGAALNEKTLREVLEQPVRLLAPSLKSLGENWSLPAQIGLVAMALATAGGLGMILGARLRSRRALGTALGTANESPAAPTGASAPAATVLWGLGATFAFTLVVLAWAQVFFWRRFVLRYDVLEAWIAPILSAVVVGGIGGRIGSMLRGVLLIGVVLMGSAQSFGDDFEPLETGMTVAREAGALLTLEDPAKPPLYTGLLWQPRYFSSLLAFEAYGRDLPFCAPELLPRPGEVGFERPVVVLSQRYRDLQRPEAWSDDDPLVGGIRRGRRCVRVVRVNDRVTVWVFAPAANPESR